MTGGVASAERPPIIAEAAAQESRLSAFRLIGLVQGMLNLYRSSKDLPSTPLVRVVN